jgi:alkylation response protein AidB-like acyl-CoA dehydrogenase
MNEFFQHGPRLGNTFQGDPLLKAWLANWMPADAWKAVQPGLDRLGGRAAGEMLVLAGDAERYPPQHLPFDPWGQRIDEIRTSSGWQALDRIAAEEGIVATAYEREHGAWSRVHQFARLYLYHPSSALYSCPLAMTDGAARVLELHGSAELKAGAFARLTSRDPQRFWTSGQWMTERTGGSDVSGTRTAARPDGEGFRLYGDKWFTSATTSQMAMALARIETDGHGDDALSLFCLELRDERGRLKDIEVHRLKDKLGTRALPTAELSLKGAPATLVGERGAGIRTVATILNITRLYNACCAAAWMRRGLDLALDYARRRAAFGKTLIDLPLHRETLADLVMEQRAAFHLVFESARLLGREECGEATEQERSRLRLLTPVVKLYTGKQAVASASEVLECFGGAGYIEDTGLPALLRDSQVLSIWEGTTNVLSLDLLRAQSRDGSLAELVDVLRSRLDAAAGILVRAQADRLHRCLDGLSTIPATLSAGGEDRLQAAARDFAFLLARVTAAVLLAEHAARVADQEDGPAALAAARRWYRRRLEPDTLVTASEPAEVTALID